MEVLVASAGFCWGIELAYERIDKLAARTPTIKATHRGGGGPGWDPVGRIGSGDPKLIDRYPGLGRVEVVGGLDALARGDVVAIGHQGIEREAIESARARGAVVHDYKCPFIARYDKLVDALVADGYDLIAFGKPKNHHCLYARQAAARGGRVGLVAEDIADIEPELRAPGRKWACVGQVTGNVGVWSRFRAGLEALGIPIRIADTLCSDSHERQSEAASLAAAADAVVVVDDGGGATTSVLETCRAVNANSFRYDPAQPLPLERLNGAGRVAVVCGILVPKWVLERVAAEIRALPGGRGADGA